MIENVTSPPTPVLITFPIGQFITLIITIVGAALGVMAWIYERTHKLDTKVIKAQSEIDRIKERMDKAENQLDDFTIEYKVDVRVSRAMKDLEDQKKEAEKKRMSSLPVDLDMDKMEKLMNKLERRLLTQDEARELVPLVEKIIREAVKSGDKEREKIWSDLIVVLNEYIQGRYNLYQPPQFTVHTS
jgi:hypothetical protein